ncbi:molybdopterin guanine dinucleotide-containing S/N-oxide reductase [Sedimentitalea nanhaiensis]|uniref:Biotin/methionine sulfoxide reductase n=1 Tax=Sedimentitalea nanhaiensis TaxID=999627 RepID=A0A1I7BP84_9RHOB|nr:molybdopterin guanine dinucleotide-containing S/N-oxide reductase [Sedimentitalea nanhaiensis]SFT88958.1 biotin/methionine sulfoxide reductase [Sedimentitalea nanhaiensis]
MTRNMPLTATHWGVYRAKVQNGRVTGLQDFEQDTDPSQIGHGIVDALNAPSRITAPMVRESWLSGGPGTRTDRRGHEAFVQVSWDEVTRLVADELARVRDTHGSQAIYAGSYGWASAGRFHHAPSQLKRFLTCAGGFTRSLYTYSFAAAEAMIPHVLGSYREFMNTTTGWRSVAQDGELVVAFGGIPVKNGQIDSGGVGVHIQTDGMSAAREAGVRFVNISPLASDMPGTMDAEWLAARPNTDVAIMLGLAHTLYCESLHDPDFMDRYCTGFDRFLPYLIGETDRVPKDADWAAGISGLPAEQIRALARRMAKHRTMISVSWSLTRADHGEQPFWMGITLAAMLGQIGLPGGGVTFGYSASNSIGGDYRQMPGASVPQGQNPVNRYIPVARITDMLENPGKRFDFNGQRLRYPDIRLIWWAGGNPYHHHQDLNRLNRAWAKPDTVIVNDWCWTATARRADIVLPCSTHLERDDLMMSLRDPYVVAMKQATLPPGEAMNDHQIFRRIAARMGFEADFTSGMSEAEWLRWLYDKTRQTPAAQDLDLPDWQTLQDQGWFRTAPPKDATVMMQPFRDDPDTHALATPSGRIEVFCKTVADFGYADCPGHPTWIEPREWLGNVTTWPLHLMSNQPSKKLHSQLDQGAISRGGKIDGREPVLLNPTDAAARGIGAGDLVRLFNDRGACLGVAQVSDTIRPGVVQMSTGAWWDPDETGMCRHGNPNVLTRDQGTSKLGQGPTAHSCLIEIEKFTGTPPPARPFEPPEIRQRVSDQSSA